MDKNNNRTHTEGRAQGRYPVTIRMLTLLPVGAASAAGVSDSTLEIHGHVMLDMGYEDEQSDPDWFDVLRPTKLPSFDDQFGEDGEFSAVGRSAVADRALKRSVGARGMQCGPVTTSWRAAVGVYCIRRRGDSCPAASQQR